MRRAVTAWQPRIPLGTTPAELLRTSREFPEMFSNLYHTAEISGQQDSTLKRLHQFYQEDGTNKLKLFAQWMPRAIYGVIAIAVGFQVVRFYSGYFNQINALTQ